jgi:hypothetical protein
MNSLIKKIKSIKANNLIIYNHNSRKLAKISLNFKKRFSFQFKKIAFDTIYHIVTKGGGIQLTLFLCFVTIFQFNMILYYLYKADHKIPYMTYYIADDLEKLDTDSIKLVEIDELNLKKMRYAFDMKYY